LYGNIKFVNLKPKHRIISKIKRKPNPINNQLILNFTKQFEEKTFDSLQLQNNNSDVLFNRNEIRFDFEQLTPPIDDVNVIAKKESANSFLIETNKQVKQFNELLSIKTSNQLKKLMKCFKNIDLLKDNEESEKIVNIDEDRDDAINFQIQPPKIEILNELLFIYNH
jgi:hypothetical protein